MNELAFKKFGEVLDGLEQVYYASDSDCEKIIQKNLRDLQGLYDDIKVEYGYKDSSDKEA